MITCLARVPSFYTQFEDNIIFFSNEGLTYCAYILQLTTSKPMLKSYIIKSKYSSTIFLICFKGSLNFSNGYPPITLSSLFGIATGKLQKLDTREGKLTYFDIRYHR